MKIVYQGVTGSFSYLAANKYFGRDSEFIGSNKFSEIFERIKHTQADYGVIPIENSLAGSIYDNYDLLTKYDLKVTGEVYWKVEHYLLALPDDADSEKRLKKIQTVYSHPKALEQCLIFFEKYPRIKKQVYADTAGAAQYVSQSGDKTIAAIASREAAELYNVQIIKEHLEDSPQNYTRFLIITQKESEKNEVNKCSIIFTVPHVPGSLAQVLNVLADSGLNLTKIESRPIHGSHFEYRFYVDFEFKNGEFRRISELLKQKTQSLQILGYYKAASI